jgi:hypothetical protein
MRREDRVGTKGNLTRCATAESCCGGENSLTIPRVLKSHADAVDGITPGLNR